MANFIKSDLEFILDQIKIAEAHSEAIADGANPRTSLVNLIGGAPNLSFGLRTVDGSLNNLLSGRSEWGAADQPFLELVDPKYLPGYQPGRTVSDATPRTISNLTVDMTANNPAAVQAALDYHGIDGDATGINALSDALGAASVTSVVLARGEFSAHGAVAKASAVADALDALVAALQVGEPTTGENAALVQAAIVAATASATAAQGVVTALAANAGVPDADAAAAQAQVDAANLLVADLDLLKTALADDADSLVDESHVVAATEAAGDATAHDTAAAALVGQLGASSTNVKQAALGALNTALEAADVVVTEGGSLVIPNVATDEGLSAPFNSWMTLFGQFFDHGLDLVNKGGEGTVFVPLQHDDPLYNPGADGVAGTADDPRTNFMVLTRATLDANNNATNATTPFVDQNQTYSSHPSHQVFLREYEMVNNKPVPTGKLIQGRGQDGVLGTGDDAGMATWADVKEQAQSKLGIVLTDADVLRVPQVATDLYGNFVPGPSGFPQLITPSGMVSGTPGSPVAAAGAIATGHAFLDDIAHSAVPGFVDHDRNPGTAPVAIVADADDITGNPIAPNLFGVNLEYDDELLDAHFIAGDGRVNENIGLISVHHVFHSEHNRMADFSAQLLLDSVKTAATPEERAENLVFLNEWLRVDATNGQVTAGSTIDDFQWDGARLFQAAKFGTEMQYQHLVFEDYARKIQPQIDVFVAPVGYDVNINPTIFAEFAHTVYRFGHSMLTETVDRLDNAFGIIGEGWDRGASAEQIGLIEAFLNPIEFDKGGQIDPDVAAGAVVRGMTRQEGNEIDEFVTDALRDSLLGLPLDLATINLARGRDTGVPTLNAARAEFFGMTGDSQLKPYESWLDFTLHLKNQASIVNFIAAYGTHDTITDATTVAEKRDAAMKIVFGDGDAPGSAPADRLDFLNSEGAWATTQTGLNSVDFWIGGLAEAIMPFGGMLGSTFNFVFETQLENLQNGDRFYYLARTAGLNFFDELEQNSFASMVMENTDAEHLPIDVFSTPAYILEVDKSRQFTGIGPDGNGDPTQSGPIPLVQRANANSLRYNGDDHVVLGGNNNANTLTASIGDDTIWGDGGNDRIEGGHGNDNIDGGAGDDIITDTGGDDVIKGGDGNDVIHGGAGLNLIIGGHGHDFIITGEDVSETFAGTGNDFILGTTTNGAPVGGAGDDWFEVGTQDGAAGDESHPFGLDTVAGHDVFFGDGGFDEYVGEGGDDIMFGSAGINRNEGMSGFDWVSYKTLPTVHADLLLAAFDETPIPPSPDTALDRYANVEGASGSHGNDTILGNDVTSVEMPLEGAKGSVLTTAGIARIAGLADLLGNGVRRADGAFDGGNILLGGDGDDLIEGRGGDDVIDGDKWLDARIGLRVGGQTIMYDSMTGRPTGVITGPTLQAAMLAGTYNPSQLSIVREIRTADGTGDVDTARYAGAMANYTIEVLAGGALRITDNVGDEGVDTLYNIEVVKFTDRNFINSQTPEGSPEISDTTPTEGQQLTATRGTIIDRDGIAANAVFTFQWQQSANGTTWTNIAGATAATFTPAQAQVNQQLRVLATYVDQAGDTETVASHPTTVVGDLFEGNANANTFNGTAGEDRAFGNGGNDTLNGNGGADLLVGGGGNDTYTIDEFDTVVEAAGGGTDTLRTTLATLDLATYPNVENVTFIGTGAFTGLGTGAANRLQGGAGSDSLNGRGGADTMVGGGGDDSYFVDNANDVVTEGGGGGIDHVSTTVSETLAGNVENMTLLGTGRINGTGNGSANVIIGNSGNNRLTGNGGNDDLRGEGGVDTLDGGSGNDTLSGGTGNDTLAGGTGNDFLTGGVGDDRMNGNGGNDTFVFMAREGFGRDTITGFDHNPANGQDLIDLSGLGITEGGFGTLVTVAGSGGNTIVRVQHLNDAGENVESQITLLNVAPGAISESDFLFDGL